MTLNDAILWFLLIFAADIVAMVLDRVIQAYRNKARETCLCDICHRPRKTKQTFDKKMWVCRACNKLYLIENNPSTGSNNE